MNARHHTLPRPATRARSHLIALAALITACTFDTAGLEAGAVNAVNTNNRNNPNPVCGDGLVTAPETCDDGNENPNDGCAPDCTVAPGWTCDDEPSACEPVCGDGLVTAPETCDDGNENPNDGCTFCAVDHGWDCASAPSLCRPEDWYHLAWSSRRTLTVPAGAVDADLVDFPLLAHLPPEALLGAQNDGNDVVFTLDDGLTKLAHEVLFHDPAARGFWAFVKVPLVQAASDTVLFVYHGNPAAPAQQDTTAVWTADFAAVLHLFEEGQGVADEYVDSSGNGLHGTGGGVPGTGSRDRSPTRDDGVFGWAQRFPGVTVNPSRSIHLRPLDDSAWSALTVSVWMNPENTADARVFGRTWGNAADNIVWMMGKTDRPKYRVRTVTDRVDETRGDNFPLNTWIHYAMVWQSGAAVSVYGNGLLLDDRDLAGNTLYVNAAEPLIGNSPLYPADPRAFLGRIQEVRVARVARTPAWLKAEADNQRDAGAFHVLGEARVF